MHATSLLATCLFVTALSSPAPATPADQAVAEGRVEEGRLQVGEQAYRVVVVEDVPPLSEEAQRVLADVLTHRRES